MKKLLILCLSVLLLVLAGCGEDSNQPVEAEGTVPDMSRAYEEAEKFLADYSAYEGGDPIKGEPVESDIEIPDMNDEDYDVYMITFVWGWPFDIWQPPSGTTVWDGTLSVNGEAVVNISRTIDFEAEQDSVLPHQVPSSVAWISQTEGDFDGYVALVFLKKGITYITPPQLTFETEPFTISYDFGQLDDFMALYQVDDRNVLAVRAVKIWAQDCPRGFLHGTWIKDDNTGHTGNFNGLWIEKNNDTVGYYNGQFWTEENGERKFSGSVSGYYTDHIIAEFSGTWYYDDPRLCPLCGTGHGVFMGHYEYLDRTGSGRMKGVFGDYSLPPEDVEMPMKGIWRDDCDHRHSGGNDSPN